LSGCAGGSAGHWQNEDYDVLADGKVVGRIYEDASASTPPDIASGLPVLSITSIFTGSRLPAPQVSNQQKA
jgi:hypothetical protein